MSSKTGHTSTKCLEDEESKKNRGKKSQALFSKVITVKTEEHIQCMKFGARTHKIECSPNVVVKDQIQQQQLEESLFDSYSSSFEEELQAYIQDCSCIELEECAYHMHYDSNSESYSDSSSE